MPMLYRKTVNKRLRRVGRGVDSRAKQTPSGTEAGPSPTRPRSAWFAPNKNPHIRRCTGLVGCGDPQPALFACILGQDPGPKIRGMAQTRDTLADGLKGARNQLYEPANGPLPSLTAESVVRTSRGRHQNQSF